MFHYPFDMHFFHNCFHYILCFQFFMVFAFSRFQPPCVCFLCSLPLLSTRVCLCCLLHPDVIHLCLIRSTCVHLTQVVQTLCFLLVCSVSLMVFFPVICLMFCSPRLILHMFCSLCSGLLVSRLEFCLFLKGKCLECLVCLWIWR